jgi:L-asparagine transporter-like permease
MRKNHISFPLRVLENLKLKPTVRLLNVLAVNIYGEAEFWLSGGKVILLVILFMFTFVSMVGGNPKHVSTNPILPLEYELTMC